jgi:hypothetical protein
MEDGQLIIGSIALMLGASWASGINLYAAILALGLMGQSGGLELPPDLEILANPLVIGAAGFMYLVEFFADKVPGVDTGWDAIHTFIRIPAGAMLAAAAVGEVDPAFQFAALILGGSLAAASHATKAGTRVVVNTSPEPFSNIGLSLVEDVAVFAGIWTALHNPWLFLALLVLFLFAAAWALPRIWRGVKRVFAWIGRLFGGGSSEAPNRNDSG